MEGRAVHKSIEQNLTHKLETGRLLPNAEVVQAAADSFEANWEGEDPVLTAEELEQGREKTKGRAKDESVNLARVHHQLLAPEIKPVRLERRFRLAVRNFPFDFVGVIDIQEPDKIRDTKTSAKAPEAGAAKSSLQLAIYGMAILTLEGKLPRKVQLDYLVKGRIPRVQISDARLDNEDLRRVLRRAERAAEVIEKEAFMPAPTDSWWCSEKWCGYWAECKYGARGRKIL